MGVVFQPAVAMPCRFGGQGGLSANQAARGPPAFRKAPGTPGSEVPAAGCMGRANTEGAWARACTAPASSSELGSFGFYLAIVIGWPDEGRWTPGGHCQVTDVHCRSHWHWQLTLSPSLPA